MTVTSAWRILCPSLEPDYVARLDRIEAAIAPKGEPLPCIVFDGDDEDAVITRFRAERQLARRLRVTCLGNFGPPVT
jgi:hypothetical protein